VHANRVFAMLQYLIRDVLGQREMRAQFAEQRSGSSMHWSPRIQPACARIMSSWL